MPLCYVDCSCVAVQEGNAKIGAGCQQLLNNIRVPTLSCSYQRCCATLCADSIDVGATDIDQPAQDLNVSKLGSNVPEREQESEWLRARAWVDGCVSKCVGACGSARARGSINRCNLRARMSVCQYIN